MKVYYVHAIDAHTWEPVLIDTARDRTEAGRIAANAERLGYLDVRVDEDELLAVYTLADPPAA